MQFGMPTSSGLAPRGSNIVATIGRSARPSRFPVSSEMPGKVLAAVVLLVALPARAVDLTAGAGAFVGIMPWSLATDVDFGAHASVGLRLTDHAAVVAAAQLVTVHVDNQSLDHPYDWQRLLWAVGPGL